MIFTTFMRFVLNYEYKTGTLCKLDWKWCIYYANLLPVSLSPISFYFVRDVHNALPSLYIKMYKECLCRGDEISTMGFSLIAFNSTLKKSIY